jgi:hypothetical protein
MRWATGTDYVPRVEPDKESFPEQPQLARRDRAGLLDTVRFVSFYTDARAFGVSWLPHQAGG